MFKFSAFLSFALALAANAASADLLRYALDRENSNVGFEVAFGKDEIKGSIPIYTAEVFLDLQQGKAGSIAVSLDATGARASFPFATQAMKGPKVLAAKDYPTVEFVSNALRIGSTSAIIQGDVTIRGVTRPISLNAQVFRQRGTEVGDLSRLSVLVTGTIRRSEFGADGWANLVEDEIDMKILVRISRAR